MSEHTKRISVAEVVEAYRVTNLKPCRVDIGSRYCGECCGMGAVVVAAIGPDNPNRYAYLDATYGVSYRNGFQDGFDDNERWLPRTAGDPDRYKQGHADGIACAAAVFPPTATNLERVVNK